MKRSDHLPLIIPAEYPELGLLAWNRDMTRPITALEAFELYERNWRHVRVDSMALNERTLVAELADRFGHGTMLA